MKAKETHLLKFLQGTKQFSVPIYQRTYSWGNSECVQLWNDIHRVATDDQIKAHFVGSVVYIERGFYQVTSVSELHVIDGQQRLTTISLLIAALGRAISKKGMDGGISEKKLKNYYLFNSEEEGGLRYKLLLTKSDKETLTRLLDNGALPQPSSMRIRENYELFVELIENSGVDLEVLYQGLNKLVIVDISLDREHDNPQLIFESLNSTGLELTQADLIRNFVLMGLEPEEQTRLYENYWYPMEQNFGQPDYSERFDRFVRDYLTLKTGQISNIREVYKDFKFFSMGVEVHNLVADLYAFSKYYVAMALERETDEDLLRAFRNINTLRVEVAYPFFLQIYADHVDGKIPREELLEILRFVESYVFRRAICGIPTNSLNKTFAALAGEIDKEQYLESFKAALALKDSYRRFPANGEFQRELMAKDVYNFRPRNYLLRKLENYDRKETVDIETYTIEHVMPQNEDLSDEWKKMLGENWREIHERYLHTIGNLTLTGYNSELSDRPFLEKRDMTGGFADSPIRLNHDLAKLDNWNEGEILARAHNLAAFAVEVWPYEVLPEEVLAEKRESVERSQEKQYTIESHQNLAGGMNPVFVELRKRILNLGTSVREEYLKQYVAYKFITNFVDIVPQKSQLRLTLNMKFDQLMDPEGKCRDVTDLGRWGNGDVQVPISSIDQIDYVMYLIEQSYNIQAEEGAD